MMSPEVPAASGAPSPDHPADDGFADLMTKVAEGSGFRCASYKERCLRRRVAVRMRAHGVHSYADYGRVLDRDPREWERLLDALTINVTKLFRDPGAFATVADHVIPALWAEGGGRLRAWSAGCASGEETYSVAALVHRYAERVGQTRLLGGVHVLGTDIDRSSLEAAAAGVFAEAAFADTPPELRARYFGEGTPAAVADELRALVSFRRPDLLLEPPPAEGLDLIFCRNVLIYFDRETQERLFASFRASLRPGGVLVLGKVETLIGESRRGFTPLHARERVLRRS